MLSRVDALGVCATAVLASSVDTILAFSNKMVAMKGWFRSWLMNDLCQKKPQTLSSVFLLVEEVIYMQHIADQFDVWVFTTVTVTVTVTGYLF